MHPLFTILLLTAACLGNGPLSANGPREELVERHLALMGTSVTLRVEAPERRTALLASEAAVRALEAVEERLSTWRPQSELSRLNACPAGEPFPLSPELEQDLRSARRSFEATRGAFDPGLGALVDAWALRDGGRLPSESELRLALAASGFELLTLEEGRATRRHAGLRIEEGGFGKGVGLDAAIEALRSAGATRATIDLGGQVALLAGGECQLRLADPRDRARPLVELRIDRGSFATSGNSQRAIEVDGRKYGHLLDPRTGRPVLDFGSISVWAPNATRADALSTALYVLGPDAALRYAARHEQIEVIVIELHGDSQRLRASAGWGGRIESLDPELKLDIEANTALPHPFPPEENRATR